jgi:hypothetical protein
VTEFIDDIVFHQQPTHNTCVSTCMAMILGLSPEEVIAEFHDQYYDRAEDKLHVTAYLKSKGVEFTLCNFETAPNMEGVYMVTVPSLSTAGGNHQILWCLENAEQEGYFYQRILDPASGRKGMKYYTNLDELLTNDPLACTVRGYGCDLHIDKKFINKFLGNPK